MKNLTASVVVVLLSVGSVIAGDAPKKVCDASGCRIVEVPKMAAQEVVRETKKVSQVPANILKKVLSGRPVRSFLRKVIGR